MATKRNRSFNFIPVLVLIVIMIFIVLLVKPEQLLVKSAPMGPQTEMTRSAPSLTPTIAPTGTPLPENYPDLPREFFENEKEMDMPIAGATVLLVIIMLGVLISKRKND